MALAAWRSGGHERLSVAQTPMARVLLGRRPTLAAGRGMRVLVISLERALEDFLRRELSAGEFDVFTSRPGAQVVRAARQFRPDIAVIDRAHDSRDLAEMEVALLRDLRPEVRIILVSEVPSAEDGRLVEAGLFFYLSASPPLRLPALVRAAATSIRQESSAKARQGELT